MKKLTLTIICAILAMALPAQAPQGISHQAVIRNAANELVINSPIGIKASIIQGSVDGTVVYSETHIPQSNANGLITFVIGQGIVINGNFLEINWTNGPYFIKTEADPAGGNIYSIIGTSQLLSVPYALYSETSGNTQGWIRDGNNLYYNDGTVSIGTSDPWSVAKLDVRGSGLDQSGIFNLGNSDMSHRLSFSSGRQDNPNPYILWAAGDSLKFWTYNDIEGVSEKMRITGSGNVGIGTEYPLSRLHIQRMSQGVANTHLMNEDLVIEDTDAVLGLYSLNDFQYSSGISLGEMEGGALNNKWSIYRTATNNSLSNQLRFVFGTNPGYQDNAIFMTLTQEGSVGIGTTTPSQKLEVAGQVKITGGSPGAGKVLTSDETGVASWQTITGSNGESWLLTGNSGTNPAVHFIGTTDNQPLKFKVNNLPAGEINRIKGNTFLGLNAGKNSSGASNTAMGEGSLLSNTTGYSNVAIGTSALFSNTIRSNLVAVGDSALYNNGQNVSQVYHATENTALGSRALYSNTRGYRNTATGYHTLYSNTTGICNTAIGDEALYSATESGNNTATGYRALYNTTGGANTAYGSYAMYYNAAGMRATALGYGAMYYSNPTTTTFDNYNVAVGYYSLRGSITPSANTGNYNTALGYGTLYYNAAGAYNIAIGSNALYNNSYASQNVAIGHKAMYTQSYANSNTEYNSRNVAVGYEALFNNEPTGPSNGIHNTALGYHALYFNSTGWENTAIGMNAMGANSTGFQNTALGMDAMGANTTGDYNTGLGRSALVYNTTGNYNTAVGYNAGPNFSNAINTIAIGYDAEATASAQVRLGNSSILSLYCMGAYVGTVGMGYRDVFVDNNGKIGYLSSSLRYKENIEDMESVDWLYSLRPVNFTYKTDENHLPQVGLIAEEVEQVKPEFVSYDNEGRPETVSYSALISPLLKAVQEQQEIIEEQQRKIELLESRVNQLMKDQATK